MITLNEYRAIGRGVRLDAGKAMAEITEGLAKKQYRPEEFSIKQLAEHTVENGREWVRSMDPRYGDRDFREAAGAVSSEAFSNITGQIVYSRLLESYQAEAFVFSALVETVPTVLNGEKIAGIGGIGDQAAIHDEGKAYTLAGLQEDWIETPATVERGLIVPITKEAVFFDRTNLVLRRAGEVGMFLGVNKEKRIIDCMIDKTGNVGKYIWKGTTYDTYKTSGGHGVVNTKASNGLTDWKNIDAALLLQSKIVDPSTGEPIISIGSDLIVCPELAMVASHIVRATQVVRVTAGFATTGNPSQTAGANPIGVGIPGYSAPSYNVRTSALWAARVTTDTDWYIGDIRGSFAYMENWPITVVTAPPNSHLEFQNGIVAQFRASERGTPATMDVRRMILNTA